MYCTAYVVLRHRGDLVVLQEDSSSGLYFKIVTNDSNSVRGQLYDCSLTKHEVHRIVEREVIRQKFLRILFAPASTLEALFLRALYG
jgi:hypothetical protein